MTTFALFFQDVSTVLALYCFANITTTTTTTTLLLPLPQLLLLPPPPPPPPEQQLLLLLLPIVLGFVFKLVFVDRLKIVEANDYKLKV